VEDILRKIYLVRHAQPDAQPGIYYAGQTDLPLSYSGTVRARELAAKLGINPTNLCCTTMLRAKQTLEYLFPSRKDSFRIIENMEEIHGGEWELKPFAEIYKDWQQNAQDTAAELADSCAPGGETLRQLQQRAVTAFEKLLKETHGDILIVLHGGVIWTLLCNYFDFDLNKVFSYPFHYCSVTELSQTASGLQLTRFNWTPEL